MPALTDVRIRSLRPRPSRYRVADMAGPCLKVRPSGGKSWRFRYRFAGKASMLDLGDYLADARKERDRQRQLLAQGIDPERTRPPLDLEFLPFAARGGVHGRGRYAA